MPPDQDPATSGTGDPPPDNSGTGTGADKPEGDATGAGQQGQEPTLTQDQVNAIVAREVAKAQRGKLDPKALGFESGKELQEYLDKQKAAAEEAKTQAEKDLEEARSKAVADAEAGVLAKANERLMRAEFVAQAAKYGVTAPTDAYVLAKTMEIWTQVELVEEGDDVTVKGFDEDFFKELKEQKSYLFGGDNGQGGSGKDLGGGAGGGKRDATDKEAQLLKDYPALKALDRST